MRDERDFMQHSTTSSSTSLSACRMHGRMKSFRDSRPTKLATPTRCWKNAARNCQSPRWFRTVMMSGSRLLLVRSRPTRRHSLRMSTSTMRLTAAERWHNSSAATATSSSCSKATSES